MKNIRRKIVNFAFGSIVASVHRNHVLRILTCINECLFHMKYQCHVSVAIAVVVCTMLFFYSFSFISQCIENGAFSRILISLENLLELFMNVPFFRNDYSGAVRVEQCEYLIAFRIGLLCKKKRPMHG